MIFSTAPMSISLLYTITNSNGGLYMKKNGVPTTRDSLVIPFSELPTLITCVSRIKTVSDCVSYGV